MTQASKSVFKSRSRFTVPLILAAALLILTTAGAGLWLGIGVKQLTAAFSARNYEEFCKAFEHKPKSPAASEYRGWTWCFPHYRQGSLMVIAPQASWAGKKLGPPGYVLLLRLTSDTGEDLEGFRVGGRDKSIEFRATHYDRQEKDHQFIYKVQAEPSAESFSADEKTFKPENGRVFLFDLTADPANVQQIANDLSGLFPHTDPGPSVQELQAAVEQLGLAHDQVGKFLAAAAK